MSNENVLTKYIAEEFLANEYFVDLFYFTELSDAAAESLSKHQGPLALDDLRSLSETAAESLSKHQGTLGLSGLTELSDAAAKSLSKLHGWLDLNGLTKLSDAAAESLSKYHGVLFLFLNRLPESAAAILRKHPSLVRAW